MPTIQHIKGFIYKSFVNEKNVKINVYRNMFALLSFDASVL